MKPLVRWTIGNATPNGYDCLNRSIESFLNYWDADITVCHNCPRENLVALLSQFSCVKLYNQLVHADDDITPMGVAWKLYPPRLDIHRHEISIDNDIVFEKRVPEIDEFLNGDCTLLLECISRTYGRFEKHVPSGYKINSGIYGMPPGFDFEKYIKFYATQPWELNAKGEHAASKTFDEQGLVAIALLNYTRSVIISSTAITNCERHWVQGSDCKGYHFIGLNRWENHEPYKLYRNSKIRMHL